MPKSRALKGIVFGILGTVMHTLMSITSKVAYTTISRDTFLVLMFGAASALVLLYMVTTRQTEKLRLPREQWLHTALVGVFYFMGATAYFLSIQITDPSLVSFFGRMQTVYVVVFGLVLLKERLNRGEVVGMAVTMAGALIITYASSQQVFLAFLLALFGESLFNALGLVSSKVAIQRGVPNPALVFYRALIIFILMTVSAAVRGKLTTPSAAGVGWSVVAALGESLAFLFINHALSMIEASKMAIIRNIQPIITVLLSLLILSMIPTPRQLLGGAISLVGVLVIVQAQARLRQAPLAESSGSRPAR